MNPQEYAEALNLEKYNHDLRKYGVRAIDYLVRESLRCATEHGFTEATPAEDIALMHSELSEALEELRGNRKPSSLYFNEDKPLKPEGVPAELADVLIRVFHFAGKHNIDLAEAVARKMLYNESRPFKHGGKVL